MQVKVLLVDDSAVIRGLVAKALTADSAINIVGTAANGKAAIDMIKSLAPDVVVLDIEMPVMDGLTALPGLLSALPSVKIIMSSTLTQSNAEISLKALSLGAADYIPKPSLKFGSEVDDFYKELTRKVKALGGITEDRHHPAAPATAPSAASPAAVSPTAVAPSVITPARPVVESDVPPVTLDVNAPITMFGVRAFAIASSTGGPQALMTLFGNLKGTLKNVPIFITQHMPPTFTKLLAEHLSKAGDRPCKEAVDGDPVVAGQIYIAPGNYHMVAERKDASHVVLRLNQDPPENFCRPAADPMLRSLSKIYGQHLAVLVLTGMGHDGMEGCKDVVRSGGGVVAQDQATSVVYGMPKAVADHKLCKAILPLPDIGPYLIRQIDGKR
jgi:two-component system chemotaxis response regulator CheB